MLGQLLSMVLAEFAFLFKAIIAIIVVYVGLAIALIGFKKYRQAIFLANPSTSERFNKWQSLEGHNYDSIDESARAYLKTVNAAAIYDLQYGRKERKRELYYERRDAYRYIKALDRMNYRGFDEQDDYDGIDPDEILPESDYILKRINGET